MHPHHTSSWIKATLIVVGSCVLNTWVQSKPLETPKAPCPQWTHSAPSQQERWEQLIIPYQQPAKPRSHYGTLIGNGLIGAEQSGDPGTDIFHLNHKGFWSGDPQYTEELHRHGEWTASPKDRRHAWEQTRKLLKEAYTEGLDVEQRLAKMKEVEEAAKGMWCTSVQATFLPMGDLSIRQPGHESNYTDYRRWLDLDGATAHVTYRYQGTVYRRQAFVSHPDRVMVVQLTNDGNVPMDMEIGLQLPPEMQGKSPDNQVTVDTKRKEVVMTGRAPIVKTGKGREHRDRRQFYPHSRRHTSHVNLCKRDELQGQLDSPRHPYHQSDRTSQTHPGPGKPEIHSQPLGTPSERLSVVISQVVVKPGRRVHSFGQSIHCSRRLRSLLPIRALSHDFSRAGEYVGLALQPLWTLESSLGSSEPKCLLSQ